MYRIVLVSVFVIVFWNVGFGQKDSKPMINQWNIGSPIFEKGKNGAFDEISVKDPTIVFYENQWHLFYTARSNNEYTTGYVSASRFENLNDAPRFELEQIRGKTRYGCVPQVFYFEPKKKWYLIYQNRDANYQPVFSTNREISEPKLWAVPRKLLEKDAKEKWIDFWVIADKTKVYLFYTEGHNGVMVRSTRIEDFPNNWGESKKIYDDVHEAVHIYKVLGENEFHMIYELNDKGVRSFGLAKADHLEGSWERVTDDCARGNQLKYSNDSKQWTEMVSHGEVIRTGYDQKLEYDPKNCRWIIQGLMKNELNDDYPLLPWKFGII